MSNIIDSIQLSGTVYTIQGTGGGGSPTVELTQAEYDALVSAGTVSANTYYIITDAAPQDMSYYWTSAQTQSAINQATSGKVNTSSVVSSVTSASTDNEIPTAKAVYDAIPTGGTGGGKAISAGTNISVTTGDTADTINCTLPLTITGNDNTSLIRTNQGGTVSQNTSFAYGTRLSINPYEYSNSAAFGIDNSIGGPAAFVCGRNNTISNLVGFGFACGEHNTIGYYSTGGHIEGGYNNIDGQAKYAHSEGYHTRAIKSYSHTEGYYTETKNVSEHASGQYNNSVSASTTFGDSGNTLFSVGNGKSTAARHNAFEVRQNGDIYITLNDQDVKLQDQLGGGGGSVSSAITSGDTNAVAGGAVYNRFDEVEQVTAAGLNALNDLLDEKLDGLKLKKLTQAEYDDLATKDSSTLYIIVNE